jgi:hypothetical protein
MPESENKSHYFAANTLILNPYLLTKGKTSTNESDSFVSVQFRESARHWNVNFTAASCECYQHNETASARTRTHHAEHSGLLTKSLFQKIDSAVNITVLKSVGHLCLCSIDLGSEDKLCCILDARIEQSGLDSNLQYHNITLRT